MKFRGLSGPRLEAIASEVASPVTSIKTSIAPIKPIQSITEKKTLSFRNQKRNYKGKLFTYTCQAAQQGQCHSTTSESTTTGCLLLLLSIHRLLLVVWSRSRAIARTGTIARTITGTGPITWTWAVRLAIPPLRLLAIILLLLLLRVLLSLGFHCLLLSSSLILHRPLLCPARRLTLLLRPNSLVFQFPKESPPLLITHGRGRPGR